MDHGILLMKGGVDFKLLSIHQGSKKMMLSIAGLGMVQKRPLDEELYDVLSKQRRHLELSDKRVSVLEFPGEIVAPKHCALGGAACEESISERDDRLYGGNLAKFNNCNETEIETSLPGSISDSSWATSTTSEEDVRLEAPFCKLPSPNSYNIEPGYTYSSLLEHPPRKLVPIGRDFQAEIPEWCGHDGEKLSSSSAGNNFEVLNISSRPFKSYIADHFLDENKFAGSCLVPLLESVMSADPDKKLGGGRIDCSCDDMGSIRCVQQHVYEVRENLRKTLGHETFVKLGFLGMGEVVAEEWSEEEEEIFREVVFSNPASLGRNFWNHLAIEFPSRTKKEIVSYYFNVFMLQKRAAQNRVGPFDIDSDNDEWDANNVSADEVIGKINGYVDSVVESPAYKDDFGHDEIHEESISEYNEDITQGTFGGNTHQKLDDSNCISNLPEMYPNEVPEKCSSDPTPQPPDQVLSDELGGHRVQDGPSTLDDARIASDVAMEKACNMKHEASNLSSGHDILFEPCSSKEWDIGYMTCLKNDDLLPTCSVIEEVFGAGAWNYQTRDG